MVMQDGAARHARCGRRLGAAAVHSRERRPQGWRGTVGSLGVQDTVLAGAERQLTAGMEKGGKPELCWR